MEKTSIKTTFFDSSIGLDTFVNFKTIDKSGVIKDYANMNCFSVLTYNSCENYVKIIVYRLLNKIPYPKEIIIKWIEELNELGFPVKLEITETTALFHLNMANFSKKFLLNSTLQLIRCLYEDKISYVPDIYFGLIKKGTNDKFVVLQKAHFNLTLYQESCLYNSNHTITCHKNSPNGISKETFLNRLAQSKYLLTDEFSNEGCLNDFWSEKYIGQQTTTF